MVGATTSVHIPDFPEERVSHDYLLGGSVILKQPVDG